MKYFLLFDIIQKLLPGIQTAFHNAPFSEKPGDHVGMLSPEDILKVFSKFPDCLFPILCVEIERIH